MAIISASDLVLGPCDIYAAPFGSAEPADSAITPTPAPPGGAWFDLGGTNGGVTFEVDITYTDLEADQVTMALGSRVTATKMTVAAKLAEVTLNNLNVAVNQMGIQGGGSGYSTLELPVGVTSTQPVYIALLIDGWAPMLSTGMPARRRIIVRKVLSQVKASLVYDKKSQNMYDCTFMSYFISNNVNPVHVVDQTALQSTLRNGACQVTPRVSTLIPSFEPAIFLRCRAFPHPSDKKGPQWRRLPAPPRRPPRRSPGGRRSPP